MEKWNKTIEDVMGAYDKEENETIPNNIFSMSNFEDGDALNKWLRLFGIDDIDELREREDERNVPEWISNIMIDEGFYDIGDLYNYYDLTEPDD